MIFLVDSAIQPRIRSQSFFVRDDKTDLNQARSRKSSIARWLYVELVPFGENSYQIGSNTVPNFESAHNSGFTRLIFAKQTSKRSPIIYYNNYCIKNLEDLILQDKSRESVTFQRCADSAVWYRIGYPIRLRFAQEWSSDLRAAYTLAEIKFALICAVPQTLIGKIIPICFVWRFQ